jgi:AraC-like DNA-binding protein
MEAAIAGFDVKRQPGGFNLRQENAAQQRSPFVTNHAMAWDCLNDISSLPGACDASTPVTYRAGGLSVGQARRALSYIDANLGAKIGISEMSAFAGLSKSHFCRAFKVTLGTSPMTYVSIRRIVRAKALITSTSERLSEIALECGFADQSHLNRKFYRIVGMSPGSWRRSAPMQSAG